MTAPHADQLIDGYLARLRTAAAALPKPARDELLGDVQSHIAEARARQTDETDATILNILDRLGEPGVVVAEARERLGLQMAAPRRAGLVEIAAVVLLPTLWIIGVVLLWWSRAWKTRDKIIGSFASLGGYPMLLVAGTMFSFARVGGGSCAAVSVGPPPSNASVVMNQTCTTVPLLQVIGGILLTAVWILAFLLPLLTSLYLVFRLRGRSRQQAALA